MTATELTAESLKLFTSLANDAREWNGTPMVDVTPAQRGNLTDLKTHGLLTTFKSDGLMYADFTEAGIEFAATLGITIPTE